MATVEPTAPAANGLRRLKPRALKPGELARLLNSTPLGEVVQPHALYRQRNQAGYRIPSTSSTWRASP
jgi:hypothetical protein